VSRLAQFLHISNELCRFSLPHSFPALEIRVHQRIGQFPPYALNAGLLNTFRCSPMRKQANTCAIFNDFVENFHIQEIKHILG